MDNINHHNRWLHPTCRYELFPKKGSRVLVKEVVLAYFCEDCHQAAVSQAKKTGKKVDKHAGLIYRYYKVRKPIGEKSELYRIHKDDWQTIWQPRIANDEITDPQSLIYKKIALTVGEYTNKIHRPADRNISYLNLISFSKGINNGHHPRTSKPS